MRLSLAWLVLPAAVLKAQAAPDDRFLGGPFDGSAAAVDTLYDRASSPQWQSVRFQGGIRDGYAAQALLRYDRASSPQWQSVRFSGGVFDGAASDRLHRYDRASSRQWFSTRFSGGGFDGHDRTLVAGLPNPLRGDQDADGLPDWWEAHYYRSIHETGADGDTDVDGMNAREEYLSGTNPTNGLSLFQWLDIRAGHPSNGWTVLRWSSETGRVYTIHAVTNPRDRATALLADGVPATPPENAWTNPSANGRFELYTIGVRP